jgi:hypothetical protein
MMFAKAASSNSVYFIPLSTKKGFKKTKQKEGHTQ